MQSPIYWHPFLYHTAMKMSYGERFLERYEALDRHIPSSCNLFEACMGDMFFYRHYLRKKNVNYSCGDINPVFVNMAKRRKIDARLLNLQTDALPKTDYILMQASLSYFIPQEGEIIRKLLAACNKQVILSESIDNLSNSDSSLKSWAGTFLSKAKAGQSKIKFTSETLRESFRAFEPHIKVWEENSGNREVIIVLEP
jgi:hypothetical protein